MKTSWSKGLILPLPGIFKELYLDTNAWSELAKGNRTGKAIGQWLDQNSGFLAFPPFSAVELSSAPRLIDGLSDFISKHRTVIVIHGDEELTGKRIFWASYYDLFLQIDLSNPESRKAFIDEMRTGSIVDAAKTVRENKNWLRNWIEEAVQTSTPPRKSPWGKFNDLLRKWLEVRTTSAGYEFRPEGVSDPTCYRGQKLQFGYLFERFYLSRKRWTDSDFIDFLHLKDMAYADAIITEKGLAHSLKQIVQFVPDICPSEIYSLEWLD